MTLIVKNDFNQFKTENQEKNAVFRKKIQKRRKIGLFKGCFFIKFGGRFRLHDLEQTIFRDQLPQHMNKFCYRPQLAICL